MSRDITWQDVVNACDEFIDTINIKMQEEPEHGKFWQEKMDITMVKREEFIILAREQRIREEEQFKQSLQIVCDNVLENSRRQES